MSTKANATSYVNGLNVGKDSKTKYNSIVTQEDTRMDKRYVCLWPGCQYSTTDSANSIKHRKTSSRKE